MKNYVIKEFQKGFEQEQARIGCEVAKNWIWPYAYKHEDLLKIHAGSDFDPTTRHYCFLNEKMVGYLFSIISTPLGQGEPYATLDFPRLLPGHEQAAELLLETALATLQQKGINRVIGRVSTMCPGDIQLAQQAGFTIHDWGYKCYYSYNAKQGKIQYPLDRVIEIDPEKDLSECAILAAKWYKKPVSWSLSVLQEWQTAEIITHLGVRHQGKLIAACLAAPNDVRPSTAAIFYIHTPNEEILKPMIVSVVNRCIEYGVQNLIVDLIYDHLQYETVYQQFDFKQVATWARCELILE